MSKLRSRDAGPFSLEKGAVRSSQRVDLTRPKKVAIRSTTTKLGCAQSNATHSPLRLDLDMIDCILSEHTRELLIEVEKVLKDSRLYEQVRDLRLQIDKEIEAARRE